MSYGNFSWMAGSLFYIRLTAKRENRVTGSFHYSRCREESAARRSRGFDSVDLRRRTGRAPGERRGSAPEGRPDRAGLLSLGDGTRVPGISWKPFLRGSRSFVAGRRSQQDRRRRYEVLFRRRRPGQFRKSSSLPAVHHRGLQEPERAAARSISRSRQDRDRDQGNKTPTLVSFRTTPSLLSRRIELFTLSYRPREPREREREWDSAAGALRKNFYLPTEEALI